jgi:hypothetical protein
MRNNLTRESPVRLKGCFWILAGVVALCTWLPHGRGVEPIAEGGFEAENPLETWHPWKWEGDMLVRTSEKFAHSGRQSLLFIGKGNGKMGVHVSVGSLSPGTYRLTGYIRAVNLQAGTWDNGFVVSLEPDGKEISENVPLGSYGWRKIERVYQVDGPVKEALLYFYLFGPGRVWLDDVTFEPSPASPDTQLEIATPSDDLAATMQASRGVPCPSCGGRNPRGENTCRFCEASQEGVELREKAIEQVAALEKLLRSLRDKRIDTTYLEITPIVARIGLETRWELPEQEEHREEYLRWVETECARTTKTAEAVLAGREKVIPAPPMPKATELTFDDGFLEQNGKPVLLYGVYPGGGRPDLNGRFFFMDDVIRLCSAVGGTRYDYKTSPIYPVFEKYPETHRTWAGGWCGHIIADRWSIGGEGGECVICLDAPLMRNAIAEYIHRKMPPIARDPAVRFVDMDFEFAYICFCKATEKMWRGWLLEKYGRIETLNDVWGTEFRSFEEVTLPEMEISRERNRAKWYDFARFNCRRFTDYMRWAKEEIRKDMPAANVFTGAPFYMLAGQMGWAGIDTEQLNNEVNDVILNESHASTLHADVLLGLSDEPRFMTDPEYHGDIGHIMAQFLHGCRLMRMWFWPRQLSMDPQSFYYSDICRSPRYPLSDVALCLQAALDVRRLSEWIIPFQRQPAEIVLLYSHDSMLQLPPALRESRTTPHLFAMTNAYEGTLYCDLFTRFTSERKIDRGELRTAKVLILPGVEYQNLRTQKEILRWVEQGGILVSIPNTWLADEHARPSAYLKELGVKIEGMELPGVEVTKTAPDIESGTGYIMGPMNEAQLKDVPQTKLRVTNSELLGEAADLTGWGVQQKVTVSKSGAIVLATLPQGEQPAILLIPHGQGRVFYLTTPLTQESFHRFMNAVLVNLGKVSPVRVVSGDGSKPFGVEARAISTEDGILTYVINLNPEPIEICLKTSTSVASAYDLTHERQLSIDEGKTPLRLRLERHEYRFLRFGVAGE